METTKLVRVSAIAALFSLAALSATQAFAQTVFDNGNPDLVFSYFSDPGTPQFMADDFTFAATTTFDTVQWYGTYGGSDNAPSVPDHFTISFFNIAFGTPNSLPRTGETFSVGAPARVDTGTFEGGFNVYRYQATLSSPITMVAGAYGIQIANNTVADTDDNWAWATANQAGSLFFRTSQAGGFTALSGNLAFQLSNSAPVVVPEAGTLALLGFALVPVGIRLVRCRK